MQDILDDHLSEIVGRQKRQDSCVAKTLAALSIASVAVTMLFAGLAGQLAADHLSAETALRLSRGEVQYVVNPLPASIHASESRSDGLLRAAREKV